MFRRLTPPASVPRCLGVWLLMTAGAAAALGWLVPQLADAGVAVQESQAGTPFEDLLTSVAVVALAGCVLWLWLVGSATTVVALRGTDLDRLPVRGCPTVVHRLVLGACGITLVGSLAGPAHAVPTTIAEEEGPPARSARVLDGLPLPDRPVEAGARPPARPAAGEQDLPAPSGPHVHTVRPGDTLWAVARSTLPGHPTDAAIDRRWREIHAANATAIGADPDLIHPGLTLRLPGAGEE